MRKIVLALIIIVLGVSCRQTNFYTFNNNDTLYSESAVRLMYETALKQLPDNYILKPTIFHRLSRKDSIINFFTFVAEKKIDTTTEQKFDLSLHQDSLFLLLNKKLPEFKLKDLNGKEFSSNQLIGKPTLINFWAISCTPCVIEIPELNMLKEKYGDKMNFIALSENTCEKDSLSNFLGKHPFNYRVLQDAGDYKHILKIGAIPRNIFIDKNGYIRYIQGNFPYTSIDLQKKIKEYDDDNYFVKIIEKLI